MAVTYTIERFFKDKRPSEDIKTGQTFEQAKAHCMSPASEQEGEWFDGFQVEQKELRDELKSAFNETWSIVGMDILQSSEDCGNKTGSIPREEVVDVLIDQMRNQMPWKELSDEAQAYWEQLTFEEMIELGNSAMHFEYYGL